MRMLVGRLTDARKVEPLESLRFPIRLGRDVFAQGKLREATMQQVLGAFQHFQRVADDFEVAGIRAIGTSAMREASNAFILVDRIRQSTGIELEVISGEEEARLIHRAVTEAIDLQGKRAVLIDIGGGSVEVTLSQDRNILSTESYNMGTVRLIEKLNGASEPGFILFPSKRPFALLVREYAEAARRRIDREIGGEKVDLCIGTGGNVEEIGKLRQKLLKQGSNRMVRLTELQDLIERLDRLSLKERIRKLNLRPDRADVLLPAAIVLQMIARETGARSIHIPHVGLKDGLLADVAEGLTRRGRPATRRDQVWESARRLGGKYAFDAEHAATTARLASQLFDQSMELHHLDREHKLLLETGALLHDIGHFIGTMEHEKHGYYILVASPIIGLNRRQNAIVANLVRYHRSLPPSIDDPSFNSLPPGDRMVVAKLCALIRLADGLDVSHTGHVKAVSLVKRRKRCELRIQGRGDLLLERWALNKRRALFEELFGIELEVL